MPASQPASASDDSASIKAARAEAEKLYAKGYDMTEEAKALDKAGKAGDAKKKYGKALKQFESAVERDNNYYQAWNMIGFCSRHSGDLKKAFAAYQKCLSIAPDYEEAHEYLGEAYLQSGDIANAKIQLAWLTAIPTKRTSWRRRSKVAPHAASAAAPGSASAPPDSSAPAARDSSRQVGALPMIGTTRPETLKASPQIKWGHRCAPAPQSSPSVARYALRVSQGAKC
jgi:hypothetical protein